MVFGHLIWLYGFGYSSFLPNYEYDSDVYRFFLPSCTCHLFLLSDSLNVTLLMVCTASTAPFLPFVPRSTTLTADHISTASALLLFSVYYPNFIYQ
jgi:hypothetical protein